MTAQTDPAITLSISDFHVSMIETTTYGDPWPVHVLSSAGVSGSFRIGRESRVPWHFEHVPLDDAEYRLLTDLLERVAGRIAADFERQVLALAGHGAELEGATS